MTFGKNTNPITRGMQGKRHSLEARTLISKNTKLGMKGIKLFTWNKGLTKHNDRILLKISQKLNGMHISPETEFKKGCTPWIKGKHHTSESKLKMSLSAKGKKLSFKTKKLISKNNARYWLGKKRSKNVCDAISKSNKGNHYRLDSKHNLNSRRNMSISRRRLWQDLSYRNIAIPAILRGLWKRPTNLEKMMLEIIKKNDFPFKYVGDGSTIINGANPDFICRHKKKIIEVASRFHHPKSYASQRRAIFHKEGYDTLVIWRNEFKNKNKLVGKVNNFIVGD